MIATINPLHALAFAIQSNPGVYALLIGSGVSRSAGILTGWEIVLDLTKKLADLQGDGCGSDPARWYHQKFGRDLDYSELLNQLAHTPAERQQLLRSYFEPNESERETGLKQPTAAHRAIARMVAGGYCRVIITTNFDNLIEQAIRDEGPTPTVISTPDAIEGAVPLVHQQCCVIKLHGDYLDTRIRNTPEELESYDERVVGLLDRILDEFGLLVCGWSGQWDTALRAAIERSPNRRYSMFWTTRSSLKEVPQRLVDARKARVVQIVDADSFFDGLAESVSALETSLATHPLSVQTAVALTKRFVADARFAIQLHELVKDETEEAYRTLQAFSTELVNLPNNAEVEPSFRRYREIIETLLGIIIHGCALGTPQHDSFWIDAIERIASGRTRAREMTFRYGVQFYAAAVLLSAGGMMAIAQERWGLLANLFTRPKARDDYDTRPLLLGIPWGEMGSLVKRIPQHRSDHAPLSEHLFESLREPLRRYLPDDARYDEVFDRFEYIRGLVHTDLANQGDQDVQPTFGVFGRSVRNPWRERSVISMIQEEIDSTRKEWPLLKHGLFNGSLQRLLTVKEKFDKAIPGLNWH